MPHRPRRILRAQPACNALGGHSLFADSSHIVAQDLKRFGPLFEAALR
jgi:hypothetical protein